MLLKATIPAPFFLFNPEIGLLAKQQLANWQNLAIWPDPVKLLPYAEHIDFTCIFG